MPSGGFQARPWRIGSHFEPRLFWAGLLVTVLVLPALSGCLTPGFEEGQQDRRAGSPGAPPPEVDWRYVPGNDRLDGSPYGVHLSFLEDPTSTLTVTWFTAGLRDVDPVVFYGDHPDELDQMVEAESHKAFGVQVMTHVATLRGLPSNTWVHYQVCGTTGCSKTFDAITGPAPGTDFRFGLIADQGTTNAALNATGKLLSLRPDMVVFAGDLAYADGVQTVWDEYFHMHEPLFARVPIMAVPGNHEYRDGLFYDAYRSRLSLPNDGLWYGFTYSDVHFTFLEFWHGSASAGHLNTQLEFFRHDLKTTEERKEIGEVSFHFVVQHYPLYGNHHSRGNYWFNIDLQEELLLRHGVDMLLVGHDHFYERSHPRAHGMATETGRDYVDPEGYIQVTAGGGGRGLGHPLPEEQIAAWTASVERRHQITEFKVSGDKVEAWTWATNNGELLDRFSLTRTR